MIVVEKFSRPRRLPFGLVEAGSSRLTGAGAGSVRASPPLAPPTTPGINILFVSFHVGTRTNFDAIAASNGWDVTHIRPANGYGMSRAIAADVWTRSYQPLLCSTQFTHIIIGDTIAAGALPFLLHAYEMIPDVTIILHISNYFDWRNEENYQLKEDLTLLVAQLNVRIVYVDRFIPAYLRESGLLREILAYRDVDAHLRFIPLSGLAIPRRFPLLEVPLSPLATDLVSSPPESYNYRTHPVVPSDGHVVFMLDRVVCPHMENLSRLAATAGVDVLHHGSYGGPLSLGAYFAVIYQPYHYSTIALQEFLAVGLRVFVQSRNMTRSCPRAYRSFNEVMEVDLMDVYTGPLAEGRAASTAPAREGGEGFGGAAGEWPGSELGSWKEMGQREGLRLVEYYESYEELEGMVRALQRLRDEEVGGLERLEADRRARVVAMRAFDQAVFRQWADLITPAAAASRGTRAICRTRRGDTV
jgi:hypothetical protein